MSLTDADLLDFTTEDALGLWFAAYAFYALLTWLWTARRSFLRTAFLWPCTLAALRRPASCSLLAILALRALCTLSAVRRATTPIRRLSSILSCGSGKTRCLRRRAHLSS